MAGKPKKCKRSWRGMPTDANGMDAQDRRNAREKEERAAAALARGLNPKTGKPPGQDKAEWQRRRRAELRGQKLEHPGFTVSEPISPEMTALELIARRKEDFQRKAEHEDERRLIHIKVHSQGPIGILHFGDPHLDDDGTDWITLDRDIHLVKTTPGLFAANIGDTTNNWVGRLARLYGQQGTSAKQAWILAEHFIRELGGKWLYMIGGNHDAWSGDADPIQWIAGAVRALYEPSEARLGLVFPNGREVIINARHDFAGSSQWNPTHGPMKAAQLGVRDDILICGHKHKSGYSPLKDPESGKICHAIQVASYKRFDRYAREKGFRDQSLSPCCVTIIDPSAVDPVDLVTVWWNPVKAAAYLTFLRSGLRRAG